MNASLRSILPANVASEISDAFDCMEIAEGVIHNAFRTKAEEPEGLFAALCPSAPLRGKSEDLYRRHAIELVARAQKGGDVNLPTAAEMLAVVLDTSLTAPLTTTGGAVADQLFEAVFPGKMEKGRAYESWNGQVIEEIQKLRRKFQVERGGVLTKKGKVRS